MTSIQTNYSHELPTSMSDDNMEIYSDFGQNVGDDDIDIDIDLAAGRNDEDYVLEDANSDIGLDSSYITEAISPQVAGNDEPMVDDERLSYAMDDVDFVPEDSLYDQEADADVSGITSNLDGVRYNDVQDGGVTETAWDHIQESGDPLQYADKQESRSGDTVAFDDKRREAEASAVVSPPHYKEEDSGQQSVTLIKEHNSSPDVYYGKEVLSNAGEEPDKVENTSTQGNDGSKTQLDHEEKEASTPINALVVYRDAEYALVSSSDSDDPDSFFFKDDTITKMPFSNLFNALREVLIDDLAPEDELYIAFEELFLEISETSIAVHDTTFAEVIDLRNSLMRNDGIEKPELVYVTLGTRTNFSKRLATLADAVAERKGISQFVSWEEVSESFEEIDETEQLTAHAAGLPKDAVDKKAQVLEEATDTGSDNTVATEDRLQEATTDVLLKSKTDDLQTGSNMGIAGLSSKGHDDHISIPQQVQGEDDLQSNEGSPSKTTTIVQQDDLDEDGDLIDYEDEEYDKELSKAVSGSEAQDENFAMENEINKVPHQRSISPAAEEADTQQAVVSPDYSVTEESTIDTQDQAYKTPGQEARDKGSAFESSGRQSKKIPGIAKGQQGIIDPGDARETNYGVDPDDSRAMDDGVDPNDSRVTDEVSHGLLVDNPDEEPDGDHASEEHIDLGDVGLNDSDYGHDDNEFGDILDSQASDVQNSDSESNLFHATDVNEEISYEETFEAVDSNDLEKNTTDYQSQNPITSITEETYDEITYEEDDNPLLDLTSLPEKQATPILIGNGLAGKRTRTESEDVDRSNKGSKRIRS